jgi:hypothetical protein
MIILSHDMVIKKKIDEDIALIFKLLLPKYLKVVCTPSLPNYDAYYVWSKSNFVTLIKYIENYSNIYIITQCY